MMPLEDLIAEVRIRYGDPDEFVKKLLRRMWAGGITQRDVAGRSGIEPSNVSAYLNGRRTPQIETMLRLDKAVSELEQERR